MNQIPAFNRLLLAGLMLASSSVMAGYQVHQSGPILNTGKTSHPSSILSIANNPAAAESLVDDEESVRMGYFANLGLYAEVGDADNFIDLIDELKDDLDRNDLTVGEADDLVDRYNEIVPILGEDAKLTVRSSIYAPFTPFAVRSESLDGVLSFSAQASAVVDVSFLDDPLAVVATGTGVELDTDSAIYFKGAQVVSGTIGYSREILRPEFMPTAQVYAGFDLSLYHVSLNKSLTSIQSILDDEDVEDVISDELDENTESSTQLGLDLGVLMTTPNAQVGMTLANINEPEFDYGEIGINCGAITNPTRQSNCLIAQQVFSDEIALKETAKMDAQATIEGAWYTRDKALLLSGYSDLNSVYDLVGNETQYVGASLSYFSDSYLIPNLRFSANKNLAGSKLTMLGVGTTLFGVANLDLAWSTETVEIDGDKIPRAFGINLGFEEKF